MPATVAIVLSARAEGRAGVGRLLGRLRIWPVGWRWWAAPVVVQPGLVVAIGVAWSAAGGNPPIEVVDVLSIGALTVNLVFLLIASLGEEIGWRGVALPVSSSGPRRSGRASCSASCGRPGICRSGSSRTAIPVRDRLPRAQLPADRPVDDLHHVVLQPLPLQHPAPGRFHVVFNAVNVAWLPVTGVLVPFALLIGADFVLAGLVFRRLDPTTEVMPASSAPAATAPAAAGVERPG